MNPYQILGVDSSADLVEIRAAYRDKAREYHPDSFGGEAPPEASAKMAELNEAFSQAKRRLQSGSNGTGGTVGIDAEFLNRERLRQTVAVNEAARASTARKVFVMSPLVALVLFAVGAVVLGILVNNQGVAEDQPASGVVGTGIELGDCVNVIQGPALLKVPCGENVDGVVIGAKLEGDDTPCVAGTVNEITLGSGVRACLS